MRATAKITHHATKPIEQIQKMLSIENLPETDMPQGNMRYCHHLSADGSKVAKLIGGEPSGFKLYPAGGYLQWHTNSDNEGYRVYLSYVEQEGCWFRFVKDGQAITLPDFPGWNIRTFYVQKKTPLWHCVYAAAERYSFGFNCKQLNDELKQFLITCVV